MQPPPYDPNKTMIGTPNSGMATQAMNPADLGRTQAVSVPTQAVAVQVIGSREATMANGPAREQFLIEISAGSGMMLPGVADSGPRTALNLCLVLDRSGSMEGQPLEYAKQACSYVVDLLGPQDTLSIVTFEEYVEVLMPPQRVTNRQFIKDGIAKLTPGNTTNLYDALNSGIQQLISGQEGPRASRMVVLSDGDPTTGIKDFHSLVNLAGTIRDHGASVTFLGFGPDYNEELLAGMAKKASGSYAYIPRPELIPEVFRLEVDKMASSAASNIKMDVKLARWVTCRGMTAANGPVTGQEFSVQMADLERGSLMDHILDLEFQNHPLGFYRVASGRISYDDALSGKHVTQDLDFIMEFTADAARYGAPANPRVGQASEIFAASRAVEKTMMGLKAGQISGAAAVQELQKTQAMLVDQGRIGEAQEVTMALRALQDGDFGGAQKTLMGTMVNLDQGKKSGQ